MKAKRCDSTTLDPTTEVQADFDDSAIGVDLTGFEPATSCLPSKRSTN